MHSRDSGGPDAGGAVVLGVLPEAGLSLVFLLLRSRGGSLHPEAGLSLPVHATPATGRRGRLLFMPPWRQPRGKS